MFDRAVESVLIATLTVVCIPALYPEPLLPMAIEVMVPEADTTAVPPADMSGWYPRPSSDPTETIIPPLGKLEIPTSGPSGDVSVPWKAIVEIPADSLIIYWSESPGAWNTLLIKMIPFSVEIPDTLDPVCSNVNSFSVPLNWSEILSKI